MENIGKALLFILFLWFIPFQFWEAHEEIHWDFAIKCGILIVWGGVGVGLIWIGD